MNRPRPKRRARAAFAMLPRAVLYHPPVDQWRPFDLAIMAGLLTAARNALADSQHDSALSAGAQSISREQEYAGQHQQKWREVKEARQRGHDAAAPRRQHTFTADDEYAPTRTTRQTFKAAGKHGYTNRKAALRKLRAPAHIEFEIRRSAILLLAGLSNDAKNLERLDLALRRLMRPVVVNRQNKLPVIAFFRQLPSGKIRLRVNGEWIAPPFGKVPMPLPTRSPVAVALFLFIHTISTRSANKGSTSFWSLCKRLGLGRRQARWLCQRDVVRALAVINAHLGKLDYKALAEQKLKLPVRYKIIADGNQVRIEAVMRNRGNEDAMAIAEASEDWDAVGEMEEMSATQLHDKARVEDERKRLWDAYDSGDPLAEGKLRKFLT